MAEPGAFLFAQKWDDMAKGVFFMSKKKRRKHAARQVTRQICGENRHHCLFQGRHWDKGYAKALREHFTFMIPVCVHNDLHNHVLHDIPVPHDVADIWRAYQAEQPTFRSIVPACDWLIAHSEDEAFIACMKRQRDFFAKNLR